MVWQITQNELFEESSAFPNVTSEQMSEVLRQSMRETVREFNRRVNLLSGRWKPENRPRFNSPINIEQQLGLRAIDGKTIEFSLENDDIWNLLDGGAKKHGINPRRAKALHFTGWRAERSDIGRSYRSTRGRQVGRTSGPPGPRGGQRSRPRNTRLLGRFRAAESRVQTESTFPPTYLPVTRPGKFSSDRAQYLGNAQKPNGIRAKTPLASSTKKNAVDHPGFPARELNQQLLNIKGLAGQNLDTFYEDQIALRLNQLTNGAFGGSPTAGARMRNASGREYFVESGKISRAVAQYMRG